MEITSFKLSPDKQTLLLELANASTATNLYLWDKTDYKVDELKIDLSLKLTGQATQTITITPQDLNIDSLDGVYFIDVVHDLGTECAIAGDLKRYEICILDEILNTRECEECPEEIYMRALNIFMQLRGLEISMKYNLVQEVLTTLYGLDKFCEDCQTCNQYKKV